MIIAETETKECKRCKIPQPLDNFNVNRHSKDGKHYYCKTCIHNYGQTRQRELKEVFEKQILLDIRNSTEYEMNKERAFTMDEIYESLWSYKLVENRFFVSGDGGYKDYIRQIKESK